MPRPERSYSATNIAHVELLITAALERGAGLGDVIRGAGHDPVVCDAHKGFDLSHEDVEILGEITRLYERLEWSPTLAELIEVRGKMLTQRGGVSRD
ncbi:MAG: hypothetical protein QOD36_1216 [Mycobacterium sp.]|jgi:hypothetical protein|nr:hypothetical protein [Mycobacterium sp.]